MTLLLATLWAGCTDTVSPEFDAAKSDAMRQGGPAPATWEPDAVLTLSHALLGDLLTQVLGHYGTLEDDISIGVATLHPALTVQSVRLGRGECEGCLGVGATLEGTLDVTTALDLASTQSPMTVDAAFDAVVEVIDKGGSWIVQLTPKKLQDADVSVGGVGVGGAKATLRDWFNERLLADVPPQEITTLGGEELPLRGVKVVPTTRAVQLHLLTAVTDPVPVPVPTAVPKGWRVDVAPSTLVKLAAAQAYEAGPIEHDILPVPTSLTMRGDTFTLGLRLWRVKGRGWWRDYEVTGRVAVDKRKFDFEPVDSKKIGQSKGAALADPLSALGQGVILQAIEGALQTTLPATHRTRSDGLRTQVIARSIEGTKKRLTATGRVTIEEAPPRKKKGKTTRIVR